MSNETTNKLIPALRFPEFVNEGEWEEDVVSQVAEYENGKAHEQDITENGKYVVVNSKFISTDGEVRKFSNFANCLAKKEDILMVLSDVPNGRAIAKCFYVDKNDTYTVNQRICKITPVKSNSRFLLYLLNRNEFFLAFDDGVKQTNLRNEDVLNCPIILPKNPNEQQKIASCLSSLDEVILAHCQKLEALKEHKKGLMQNLFPQEGERVPKWRFKEFEGDGEWVEKKLGEVLNFVMGNAFKSEDFVEDGLQLIRMGNLYNNQLQLNRTPVFLPKSFAKEYSQFLVRPRDLLMSMTGTLGKRDYGFVIQIPEISSELLLNQRVLKIIPKQNCTKEFMLQQLKNDIFLDKLYSIPGGTKQANLSTKDLKEIKISLPQLEEQQKIASCLSSLDELIVAQTEKVAQLKLHKKGLMQGLFVGV